MESAELQVAAEAIVVRAMGPQEEPVAVAVPVVMVVMAACGVAMVAVGASAAQSLAGVAEVVEWVQTGRARCNRQNRTLPGT